MTDNNTLAPAVLVEDMARAMAQADNLDWDEVCGCDTEVGDCESSTCIAAWDEDHDADLSRRYYRGHAKAAIVAYQAHMASDGVVQADRIAVAQYFKDHHAGTGEDALSPMFLAGQLDDHPMVQFAAAHRRAAAFVDHRLTSKPVDDSGSAETIINATPQTDPRDALAKSILAVMGNVKHDKPGGSNDAMARGIMLETIREIALANSEGR